MPSRKTELRLQNRLLLQRERRLMARLRRIRSALLSEAVRAVQLGSSSLDLPLHQFQTRVEHALRAMSEQTATQFGNRVLRQLAPRKDTQDTFIESVRRWLLAHAGSRAVTITGTQRETLMTILVQAEQQNLSRRQIVNQMRAEFDLTAWQIDRIARTETHTASQVGAQQAAEALGVPLLKDWISAEDSRTRPRHAEMDSIPPLPLNEPFPNGLMYPGDPAGPASETINCRCVLAYRPAQGGTGT